MTIESPRISVISFVPAPADERQRGLVAWLTLVVGELLLIDAVALRRARAGRLYVAFPSPIDRRGRRREVVRPLNAQARRAIEAAVRSALDTMEEPR